MGSYGSYVTIGDAIQLLAVLAAVGASITALVIATKDLRTQLAIAEADRGQSRLAIELDYAIRLSAHRNMGGSTDDGERKRLSSEALALAGVVGERWVPASTSVRWTISRPSNCEPCLTTLTRPRPGG